MGAVFRLTAGSVAPRPGARVLRADEFSRLVEASGLLAAAGEHAEAVRVAAEEAYEARRREGYEDGMLEGRMAQAEKMMETAMQAVEYIEKLESTLVGVVGSAVRKIIGELDDRERIVRVVRTALTAVRGRQKVIIRVCPSDEAAVRESLPGMADAAAGAGYIDVAADPRMKPGDCVLESELGVVEAGLEHQIAAIERALAGRIRES